MTKKLTKFCTGESFVCARAYFLSKKFVKQKSEPPSSFNSMERLRKMKDKFTRRCENCRYSDVPQNRGEKNHVHTRTPGSWIQFQLQVENQRNYVVPLSII